MVANVKKLSKGLVVALLGATLLVGCSEKTSNVSNSNGAKTIEIGIVQHVEHPALDAAQKGFKEALEKAGYKDGDKIKLDVKVAQGDTAANDQISKKFASDKKDLILAIATPSAQAAYNSSKEIPILITAVTDPVGAGLVKSMDKSGTNVTGTSDLAPMKVQFELIKKVFPNAKKVGIMYNAGEANSVVQAKEAAKVAKELGLELVPQTVTSTNDVAQATDSLASKVDVIYIPTDNTVVSAAPVVADRATAKKVPVVAAEPGTVESGALFTEGISYYDLGIQTGNMAVEILKGKKPQDMKVETANKYTLTVNKKTLDKLGIKLPEDLQKRAQFVGGDK